MLSWWATREVPGSGWRPSANCMPQKFFFEGPRVASKVMGFIGTKFAWFRKPNPFFFKVVRD